ncbi:MAG: hypothetical protein ABI877_12945 [Gemmatimonadaceae bacterium]
MTETQWRFLKAISDRVPDGRIVELRLFPSIRQSGAESGVAVVAVELFGEALPAASGPNGEAPSAGEKSTPDAVSTDRAPSDEMSLFDTPSADDDRGERAEEPVVEDHQRGAAVDVRSNGSGHHGSTHEIEPQISDRVAALGADSDGEENGSSPINDSAADPEAALPLDVEPSGRGEVERALSLDDMLDIATDDAVAEQTSRRVPKRYAVLAARYRLTLKGPDRGQWDFEVTHEADAPLDTVDRVARGVARRAGDAGEPESYSAFQLRSALAQPWWNTTT